MARKKRIRAEKQPEATGCIKFSADRTGEGYAFKSGQTYTLPLSSCNRWVRRGVAEFVAVTAAAKPKVPDFETTTMKLTPEMPEPPTVQLKAKGVSRGKSGKND